MGARRRTQSHLSLYKRHAGTYATLGRGGTFYPVFRRLTELIKRHVSGRTALDFGCGSGRTMVFLRELGFKVIGVDISAEQIAAARKADPNGQYHHLKGKLSEVREQIPPQKYDLVLANIVFPEIATKRNMVATLNEMRTILAPNGKIVVTTVTPEAYQHNWVSYRGDHPENRDKKSGERVKLTVAGTDMVFYDYLWKRADFHNAFRKAGLTVIRESRPLGRRKDGIKYVNETRKPFWHIYVLKPSRRKLT